MPCHQYRARSVLRAQVVITEWLFHKQSLGQPVRALVMIKETLCHQQSAWLALWALVVTTEMVAFIKEQGHPLEYWSWLQKGLVTSRSSESAPQSVGVDYRKPFPTAKFCSVLTGLVGITKKKPCYQQSARDVQPGRLYTVAGFSLHHQPQESNLTLVSWISDLRNTTF